MEISPEIKESPLTYGQQAIWFLYQMDPESAAYNAANAARVISPLDYSALKRAIKKLVDRHPMLRTTFTFSNGEPVQREHPYLDFHFRVEDATSWTEAELNRCINAEIFAPFDIEHGPLFRVTVFKQGSQNHLVILNMFHLITDMWSIAIFMYEVSQFYASEVQGTPPKIKPVRTHYFDWVQQQQELLAGPEGENMRAYWLEQLKGELPRLNLPITKTRPQHTADKGMAESVWLDTDLSQKIIGLSRSLGKQLYELALAAFIVLLHRYTGQDDILIGFPKAGRTRKVARTLGYFINPVVIRATMTPSLTFTDFLAQIHETLLAAADHDMYPFPLLVEELQPDRESNRYPIFDVAFLWQKTTHLVKTKQMSSFAVGGKEEHLEIGNLQYESVGLPSRVTPFELAMLMGDTGEKLTATLEYSTDLYDAPDIQRMLGHFETLLNAIAADPNQPITDFPLLTRTEQDQLLTKWHQTAISEKEYRSIPDLFAAQVEKSPEKTALVLDGKELNYTELNARANRVARHLQKKGVTPGTTVGLFIDRSLEAIIGLLGILKAGGVYVPLDPAAPQKRTAFILEDAGISIVLSSKDLQETIHNITERPIVRLDADWQIIAQKSATNLTHRPQPEDLAYIIYTSGSTGKPKGVLISHGSIATHCQDVCEHFELTSQDRVLQFAAYVFDQSIEQILTALICGATLVLRGPAIWPPSDFSGVISNYDLTVVNLPPSYWYKWMQDWDQTSCFENPQLRLVIIGGDEIRPEMVRTWQQTPMHQTRLLNAYGPTETTITALTYEFPSDFEGSKIPIGRPLANRKVYVLDPKGDPVPVNIPGELHLGGQGLAQGYLNRDDLTAKSFISDPFDARPDARLYKTGDLVRYLPDGNLEFLGRVDLQVKIRGYRLELGEVESALNQHPGVQEAVVTAREDEDGEKHLLAYLTSQTEEPPSNEDLRKFITSRLPLYMLPAAFMWLEEIPLTPSGKVNRKALPAVDLDRLVAEADYVAPRTPLEEEIAQLWAEVLNVERVGIHDHFFDLGGHSLLAAQLVARVRDHYHVELPLRDLFETPTVAGLATLVTQSLAREEEDELLNQLLAELDELSDEETKQLLASESEN